MKNFSLLCIGILFENLPEIVRPVRRTSHAPNRFANIRTCELIDKPVMYIRVYCSTILHTSTSKFCHNLELFCNIREVLDWMIGFIAPYTSTIRDYRYYSTITDLHTLLFTVTQALGFLVGTIRILTADY
jgi:hypothetical protein